MDKKPKKILYIITKSVWAGAGKYVYDLATALPRENFDVSVAGAPGGELRKKIIVKAIPYFEIKNFQRDVSFLKDISAFFEIVALVFRIRPDIIHVSSPKAGGIAGPAILIYKILSFHYSLPSVFTAHGWTFNEKRPEWQLFLIKIFSKITCLFYKKIICVSEFDRKIAIKNKIAPRKKLLAIHNGIKIEEHEFLTKQKAREKLIAEYGLPLSDYDFLIGSIGEFTKNKGQKYLVDAILKLKNIHKENNETKNKIKTVIIGFGEDKQKLERQISDYKLEKEIFLLNNLHPAYPYLKAFDIFILPSLKEGLPYVLLEAGLASLPVIATNVGGVGEIIEDKDTGILIDPANPLEIKKSIKKIMEDSKLRNELPFKLWEKINRDFNFKQTLKSTLAAYDDKSQSR
ncbi:MAG: glycosyltransferase [Candidatus Pacebacteria bacterium]|nr:glycosyltransferase [Candidatus Paceibacterota bacterium]